MKKIVIVSLAAAILVPAFALAQTAVEIRENNLRRMMGDASVDTIEKMEKQMLGANYERMEQLMDKMLAGSLTAEEQKEMIRLMQDNNAGPGVHMMMSRMMLPDVLLRSGTLETVDGYFSGKNQSGSNYGYGMMGSMMGGTASWFGYGYWITIILTWVALALGIAALWQFLTKKHHTHQS